MNSVQEPGSRTMSKNRLRNSIESNRAKNRLSAQPTGPAARPGRAPSACLPRACSAQRPARPAPHAPSAPRAQRPARPAPMPPGRVFRLRKRACSAPAACASRPAALLLCPCRLLRASSAPAPAYVPRAPAPARPARSPARLAPASPAQRPAQRPTALCSMGCPFQVLHTFFFSLFFHFFQPLENTKKNIYLFIFFHFPIHQKNY